MYHYLREVYQWNGIKKDNMGFVDTFHNCQQVKVDHQRSGGPLQDVPIPTWRVNMDFTVYFPRTRRKHDSIWVMIDRMTKSTHFILFKASHSVEDYTKFYIREIVKLDGVSLSII